MGLFLLYLCIMKIIDGKKLSQEILSNIKKEVESLHFQPIFCDVLVGEDKVSMQYVDMKMRRANAVGIAFHKAHFPESITTEELIKEIQILNKIPNMCGVILQLPLPDTIDTRLALDAVDPDLDVDCLGTLSSMKFYDGDTSLGFPTAFACIELLKTLDVDLKGKNIVVLGQGNLVGKPVTALFRFMNLSPVVVDSKTENKEEIIKQADIIISAIGQEKYIKGDMVKSGVVLIDAGASESGFGIVGDVDMASMDGVEGYLSPVPGGVGPVTVAMLLANVLSVAKKLSNIHT